MPLTNRFDAEIDLLRRASRLGTLCVFHQILNLAQTLDVRVAITSDFAVPLGSVFKLLKALTGLVHRGLRLLCLRVLALLHGQNAKGMSLSFAFLRGATTFGRPLATRLRSSLSPFPRAVRAVLGVQLIERIILGLFLGINIILIIVVVLGAR